jgi:cytochrome c oxidase subunit II
MRSQFRDARRLASFGWGASILLLTGCEMPLALRPRGPAAAEIANIWWILFWTATVVSVIVFALLAVAIVRARSRARAEDESAASRAAADDRGAAGAVRLPPPGSAAGVEAVDHAADARRAEIPAAPPPVRPSWLEGRTTAFVIIAGGIIPTIILGAATFLTLRGLQVFDRPPAGVEHTILVRGHMFWWEIEYPDHGFTTANEVHVPVGQSVRFELESADVIHSFWVPQLHGKLDMIPGKTNVLYVVADEPGVYFGKCAEFCGQQHANMEFQLIAQPQEEFEAWLEAQAADAAEPTSELAERGREVFVGSQCALCHTIRGVSTAAAEVGPDLTHLASRQTLAARTLTNVRGNLGGWILDPQGIKPGNRMPAVNLPSEDFLALLEYLEELR